jgi:glucokinase
MITQDDFYTIGIDIGGTKTETALLDAEGQILHSHYQLLGSSRTPETIVNQIIDSINICQKESGKKASAVGIGIAGQVTKSGDMVRFSPNLPYWVDVPLKDMVRNTAGLPVFVSNDVRMITWGEWKHGAGQGFNDLVCVFVGTGVGGGIVSGGHLLEGDANTAGEIGHMTIVAGGRKCHCGNEGCLEAYAGGWAIAERAQNAVKANHQDGTGLLKISGDISDISAVTVSEAYNNNDPLAHRLIKDTSRYLSAGIISIVNAFNPRLIILGGGIIQGIPELASMVEKQVKEKALPSAVENLSITISKLGNKAGIIGAAAQARYSI